MDPLKAVLDARRSVSPVVLVGSSSATTSAISDSSTLNNIDGGRADTNYGGMDTINGGNA